MSEEAKRPSEAVSRRRDALLKFGRFAAVAPTTVVLLTGEAEAYGEDGGKAKAKGQG